MVGEPVMDGPFSESFSGDSGKRAVAASVDELLCSLASAESVEALLRAACRALRSRTVCDIIACAWTRYDTPAVAIASERPLGSGVASELATELARSLASEASIAGAMGDDEGVVCYVLAPGAQPVYTRPLATLDFPVRVGGVTTGTICIASTLSEEVPAGADRQFCETIAAVLSPHLEALRLRGEGDLAPMRDPLTGVYTAALFNSTVEREIARSERHPSEFSIVFLDLFAIDPAQRSEASGPASRSTAAGPHAEHPARPGAGPAAADLATVASIMQQTLRRSDIVARLGPARFGIFMPETGPRNALIAADRIQQRIKATGNLSTRLVARMGISGWAITGAPREELYSQAELAVEEAASAASESAFLDV